MTLVDSNVLLELIKDDPRWAEWSLAELESAAIAGPVLINPIIYAELSVGYSTIEALDAFIEGAGIQIAEITKEALFLAGKAFARYRRAGGAKIPILPDFFIGAQAAIMEIPLLTRDEKRFRTYFPGVVLISPTTRA